MILDSPYRCLRSESAKEWSEFSSKFDHISSNRIRLEKKCSWARRRFRRVLLSTRESPRERKWSATWSTVPSGRISLPSTTSKVCWDSSSKPSEPTSELESCRVNFAFPRGAPIEGCEVGVLASLGKSTDSSDEEVDSESSIQLVTAKIHWSYPAEGKHSSAESTLQGWNEWSQKNLETSHQKSLRRNSCPFEFIPQ